MVHIVRIIFSFASIFYLSYLLIYSSYLFISVVVGAWTLYIQNKRTTLSSEISHAYYYPVSIVIAAFNEELTIVDTVKSAIALDYKHYEIIIVDDGSQDNTADVLIKAFDLLKIKKPLRQLLRSKSVNTSYEQEVNGIHITLLCKDNGGKGDALNAGINVVKYPYFLCVDADSFLQPDSLEKLIHPVMEDEHVIAVGGSVRASQCINIKDGNIIKRFLPSNIILGTQVVEYNRSFLASRILLDYFNSNLIISGAFGLFKKDMVVAVGGYDSQTLGEDMELVMRLHAFCRNNKVKYLIRYAPNAICWSQIPMSLKDLIKQRNRWHLGLFQSLFKYKKIMIGKGYRLHLFFSYLYYLFYELLSPFFEILGLFIVVLAVIFRMLNYAFMVRLYITYLFFGVILSMVAYFQKIYTTNIDVHISDVFKLIYLSSIESFVLRYFLSYIRLTAFWGYHRKKDIWGKIKRTNFENN